MPSIGMIYHLLSFTGTVIPREKFVYAYSSPSASTNRRSIRARDPNGIAVGEMSEGVTRVRPLHASPTRTTARTATASTSVSNNDHQSVVRKNYSFKVDDDDKQLRHYPYGESGRLATVRNNGSSSSNSDERRRKSSLSISQPMLHSKKCSKNKHLSRLLTQEEEIIHTTNIQNRKDVIRVRDELAQNIMAEKKKLERTDIERAMMTPDLVEYRHLPLYAHWPSEEEWAKGCGISIMELRQTLVHGRKSKLKLLEGNAGLVMQIAKRYFNDLKMSVEGGGGANGASVGTTLTLQDMVQEGNVGLMEAAERYDSAKGARFGTYATYWVKNRILKSIEEHSRIIRLPAHVHSSLRSIRKVRDEMKNENGRTPSLVELAHRLGISVEKLRLYTGSSRSVLSLEGSKLNRGTGGKAGAGERDKRTLGDHIASDSPTPEEDAELDAMKQDIRAAIRGLGDESETDVVILRYGLEDGNPMSLEQTGQRLGLSAYQVKMVEMRALNKLRHRQRHHRLKDYVGDDDHSNIQKKKKFFEKDYASDADHLNSQKGTKFYERFQPRYDIELRRSARANRNDVVPAFSH